MGYYITKYDEHEQTFWIIEVEHARKDPTATESGYTAEDASVVWRRARTQAASIMFKDTKNNVREIGVAFDPSKFERAVYSGYVSYGISMTDGVYVPIKFEQWIKSFRKDVLNGKISWDGNDAPNYVKDSLLAYADLLRKHS